MGASTVLSLLSGFKSGNHKVAELKWQKKWQDADIFKVAKNKNKKK